MEWKSTLEWYEWYKEKKPCYVLFGVMKANVLICSSKLEHYEYECKEL